MILTTWRGKRISEGEAILLSLFKRIERVRISPHQNFHTRPSCSASAIALSSGSTQKIADVTCKLSCALRQHVMQQLHALRDHVVASAAAVYKIKSR